MSKNSASGAGFQLDEFGRAILTEAQLAAIEDAPDITSAGSNGTSCSGSTNNSCTNRGECTFSTNELCTNSGICYGATDTQQCRGPLGTTLPGPGGS